MADKPVFDVPLTAEQLAEKFGESDGAPISPGRPAGASPGSPRRPSTPRATAAAARGATPRAAASPTGNAAPIVRRIGKLEKKLSELYESVGAAVCLFDPVCGTVLIETAPRMAQSLSELAEQNAAVKKALNSLLEKSAITMVVLAHAPLFLVIAAHHTPLTKVVARRAGFSGTDEEMTKFGNALISSMVENLKNVDLTKIDVDE